MEWLAAGLDELQTKYVHGESYSTVDKNVGTMMSISALIASEGGWKDKHTVGGIVRLVVQCSMMGGNWTGTDPQTGIATFRRLRFEQAETFEESWKTFTEYVAGKEVPAAPTDVAAKTGKAAKIEGIAIGDAESPTPKARAPSNEPVKGSPDGKGKGKSKDTGKEKRPQNTLKEVTAAVSYMWAQTHGFIFHFFEFFVLSICFASMCCP